MFDVAHRVRRLVTPTPSRSALPALLALTAACGASSPPSPPSTATTPAAQPSAAAVASPAAASSTGAPAGSAPLPVSPPATTAPSPAASTPTAPPHPRVLATGTTHACALLADATVRCWGANGRGELGDGSTVNRSAPTPVRGLGPVAQVAAGEHHTCARGVDGTVWCWGEALSGRLGVDGAGPRGATQVPGLSGVVEIALGRAHGCARLGSGEVRCWGSDQNGQLGDHGSVDRATPIAVKMPGDAVPAQIAAGGDRSCARLPKGVVHCWGWAAGGALAPNAPGVGDDGGWVTAKNEGAVTVAMGRNFSFALMADGALHGWGVNYDGILLWGGAPFPDVRVTRLPDAADVVDVSAGEYHVCAILRDRTARCWGHNLGGELADGSLQNAGGPIAVKGLDHVVEIAMGDTFLCALDEAGAVRCAGGNEAGQLGDGTTKGRRSFAPVLGLSLRRP